MAASAVAAPLCGRRHDVMRTQRRSESRWQAGLAVMAALAVAGCGRDNNSARADAASGDKPDATWPWVDEDDLASDEDMSGVQGVPNECGDHDPGCIAVSVGPPGGNFPLHTDPMKDPHA